jgi:hypothetical protein
MIETSKPIQPMDEITFSISQKWIIKINSNGFTFNRIEFPDWNQDDFCDIFLNILEKECEVEFKRKNND